MSDRSMLLQMIADEFEITKMMCEKKGCTKSAHAVHPVNDGHIILVVFNAGLRNRSNFTVIIIKRSQMHHGDVIGVNIQCI